MAELHILGHISNAIQFTDSNSLFCKYYIQAGPNWTLLSGCPEGQTAAGKVDYDKTVAWSHPLDLHYISRGIQGWPKLTLQVHCVDSLDRSWVVGYASCSVPSSPGHHALRVPCWAPAATTITDRLRQKFLGGAHELTQTDIINLGSDRLKLITKSKGDIELSFYLVLRNFTQFGVEYK